MRKDGKTGEIGGSASSVVGNFEGGETSSDDGMKGKKQWEIILEVMFKNERHLKL